MGNSKGIILSKTILDKYNIDKEVNVRLEDKVIIIEPTISPRLNWDAQFKKMNQEGDDELMIPDVFENEKIEQWK